MVVVVLCSVEVVEVPVSEDSVDVLLSSCVCWEVEIEAVVSVTWELIPCATWN